MSNRLVIMIGVPGSGKSFEAKQLAQECEWSDGMIAVICSADHYFERYGAYQFDASKLSLAHTFCQGKCLGALEAQADLVIIDNTNVQKRDRAPYIAMAKKYGYEVEERIVGEVDEESLTLYAGRNQHGVGIDIIRRFASRLER